ncbi:MAG: hypothetical protein AAB691_04070, partial [Patescibacteria group bacterium]
RLIRNRSYTGSFRVTVDGDTADVLIENGSVPNQVVITSTSTVMGSQKTVQAIVSISSITGQVSVVSINQL